MAINILNVILLKDITKEREKCSFGVSPRDARVTMKSNGIIENYFKVHKTFEIEFAVGG